MKLGIVLSSILVALLLCLMFWPKPETEPEPERVTALVEPTNIVLAPSGSVKVSVTPDISEPEVIEAAVEDPEEEKVNDEETGAEEEYSVLSCEPAEEEAEEDYLCDSDQWEADGYNEPTGEESTGEVQEPQSESYGQSLGTWTITAYCGCDECCGSWSGSPTASGAWPVAGRTIAADLPFGTVLYIEGLGEYVVEDRGVYGEWIDIYFDDHDQADTFGLQYREVYLVG